MEGAVRLADWGLIAANGPDAKTFLHGQLTQDMASLSPGRARLTGYCSAKGRLQASFITWQTGSDEVLLACSADLLAPTLKRLSMFVLRAKCKLTDQSDGIALYGLVGPVVDSFLGSSAAQEPWSVVGAGDGHAIRLPDVMGLPRWVLAQPADAPPPALPALAASDWAWLEVRSGIARIVAATVEQFVPQMVNLELVGGVNFQKGCYPGQEVVARSQYRGTLKRRLQIVDCTAPVAAGDEVFHSVDPGQPAGMVVAAAAGPDGTWSAQVELKLALVGVAGELRCADAVLTLAALPYAIPSEAA